MDIRGGGVGEERSAVRRKRTHGAESLVFSFMRQQWEMCPFVPRLLQQCNDVESNPGPLMMRPGTNKSTSSSSSNSSTSYASLRRARQQQINSKKASATAAAGPPQNFDLGPEGELEVGIGHTRVDRLGKRRQHQTKCSTTVLHNRERREGTNKVLVLSFVLFFDVLLVSLYRKVCTLLRLDNGPSLLN